MIGSIIFIGIVASAVGYLVLGVQKNKKTQVKVEEVKPKATKQKATQAAKPKVTVTKQNKTKTK